MNIFNFSHPLILTEVLSLLGDKFSGALPFDIRLVDSFESADVILWDGIITLKNQAAVTQFLEASNERCPILLLGESRTLLSPSRYAEEKLAGRNIIELPGWNVLPEELLGILEDCYKKLQHV